MIYREVQCEAAQSDSSFVMLSDLLWFKPVTQVMQEQLIQKLDAAI